MALRAEQPKKGYPSRGEKQHLPSLPFLTPHPSRLFCLESRAGNQEGWGTMPSCPVPQRTKPPRPVNARKKERGNNPPCFYYKGGRGVLMRPEQALVFVRDRGEICKCTGFSEGITPKKKRPLGGRGLVQCRAGAREQVRLPACEHRSSSLLDARMLSAHSC